MSSYASASDRRRPDHVSPYRPSLQDVYLEITGGEAGTEDESAGVPGGRRRRGRRSR